MIAGPDSLLCCRARLDGYRAALEASKYSGGRGPGRPRDLNHDGGWAAAGALLDLPDRPTALLATNDVQALGAYRAARERGLRIFWP